MAKLWVGGLPPGAPRRVVAVPTARPAVLASCSLQASSVCNPGHPTPACLHAPRHPGAGIPDRDVEDTFAKFGRLRSCWVARKPPGFGFGEPRPVGCCS